MPSVEDDRTTREILDDLLEEAGLRERPRAALRLVQTDGGSDPGPGSDLEGGRLAPAPPLD